MSNTPVCSISATGVLKPLWADCLNYFRSAYQGIYGADVVDDPATMDTQFLYLLASALDDVNAECVGAYNSFSPVTAQGDGLSSNVKINGIARLIPSYSTCPVVITGTVGVTITNGIVQDINRNTWALPASVVIPPGGTITVTAMATTLGAIAAQPGEIAEIFTPVYGWDSVNNLVAASLGAPVETDAALRQRQTYSASLPAIGSTLALQAAIAATPNVSAYRIYENPAPSVDSTWGIPGYSIAVVVAGGGVDTIASLIALKKGEGVATYGTTAVAVAADAAGIVRTINYSVPVAVPITFSLQLILLSGFTAVIQSQIQASLSAWASAGGIGGYLGIADAYMAARLNGGPGSNTYRIVPDTLVMARDGAPPAANDVAMAYNETPTCIPGYVTINIVNQAPPTGPN